VRRHRVVDYPDHAAGNAVADHLGIALTNTFSTEMTGVEIYGTFTDATA